MLDDQELHNLLKKIISIKNVGKFVNVRPQKGVNSDLSSLNIYYAENGSGKTTFSTILRSLSTEMPEYLIGKKSISGEGEPEVEIHTYFDGKIAFKNGRWTKPFPAIEIFDARFIHDNIFRGSSIELDHRRNLYQFILGEEGVSLAQRLLDISGRIKEIDSDLKPLQKGIEASIVGTMSVEEFILLSNKKDIFKLVEKAQQEVASMSVAHEIRYKDKPGFVELPEPEIDALCNFLKIGIDDISEAAAKNIALHISSCMDEKGESWIFQGLQYIRDKKCPFCKQNISGNDLTESFRRLFREAYTALKKEAEVKIKEYSSRLSESQLRSIEREINKNESLFYFWESHVRLEKPDIRIENIDACMSSLRTETIRLLNKKHSSPAEPIKLDNIFMKSAVAYQEIVSQVGQYNQTIITAAKAIDETKSKSADTDLETKRIELNRLLSIQKRYESRIDNMCLKYSSLHEEKQRLKVEKDTAKHDLDNYSVAVLSEHEESIKRHLGYFGAQFYPSQFQKDYSGGKPGFNFRLTIDGKDIKLGSDNTSEDQPSFRNTLSEGDKQSLAFAFFLSKLEKDPELCNKVVVFDDPICSLDVNRKAYTLEQIIKVSRLAKQVILLSHDPYFLKSVSSKYQKKDETKLFKIHSHPTTRNSNIVLWNIDADTQSSYLKDFFSLHRYLEEGTDNAESVARRIRPVLEANLRMRFPDHFNESEWLGNFIDKVRANKEIEEHPLYPIKTKLSELCAVNDYSKKYHHDQNSSLSENAPINLEELTVFVKRTLLLLR